MSLARRGGDRAPSAYADAAEFEPRIDQRRRLGAVFLAACVVATAVGLVALVVLLVDVAADGLGALSWHFLTGKPSRFASRAGLGPAFVGTLWVLLVTAAASFPLGVATAIWLEEYAPNNRWRRMVQINIANLAGVPSVVYGILGLAVFVRWMQLGRSVAAGGLTLTLLILPVIIIAAQEAIRAVPNSIRLGAYGLGATKWQVVSHHVLPMALPGILTGTILALSRAVGETAPLIMIGALLFVPFVPRGLLDSFTVIPMQVYNWIGRPQPEFHDLAAGGIMVLLAVLLTMNTAAILLRNRYTRDDS
ncbi:MAG: phosphate ABC transporter permease PstA [Gemmatimonadota bacterium]